MLNWAHIHLMLNHIPAIGIGVVIAFLLAGRARGSRELEWVSLQMFVALALVTIPVYFTGSPASHLMREVPGVARETIQRHSSASDFAFATMEALGALSLGTLVKFRSPAVVPARLTAAVLALALAALGLMIWTANLGGRIRHPEIGTSNAVPPYGTQFLPLVKVCVPIESQGLVSNGPLPPRSTLVGSVRRDARFKQSLLGRQSFQPLYRSRSSHPTCRDLPRLHVSG